jgi:adenylate cyclase class 2
MAIEIELKAWVDDPETTKALVSSLARYTKAFEKEDVYWYPPKNENSAIPTFGIRIRKETNNGTVHLRVTYKTREKRDFLEVNNEREFIISDRAPFEELLGIFGLEAGVSKCKRGWSWTYGGEPPISIELSEVKGLGCFVELEILSDKDDAETVSDARSRLMALLRKLGVAEERIESRYYTEMLGEKVEQCGIQARAF